MNITFFGPDSNFLPKSLFRDNGDTLDVTSQSATLVTLLQPETGYVTTLTGTDFAISTVTGATSGTITGISFAASDGTVLATFSDIAWALSDFQAAALAVDEQGNAAPFGALLSSSGPITIDASGATDRFDMDDFEDVADFITQPVVLTGTGFNDELIGGQQNDTINPGTNDGYDRIHGTIGNDLYLLGAAEDGSYYEIEYDDVAGPITLTADGATNSLSVAGAGFTDTFQNPLQALNVSSGGLGFIGTTSGDVFDVTLGDINYIALSGGAGNDTFNLDISSFVRLFYNWDGITGPTQGIVANLATGVVSDGLGGTDQINMTGGGRLEIRATDFADNLVGGAGDESFITEQGNDTVDGGDGFDRIRYDRSGVDAVTVDLAAGTATGIWDGNAFADTLSNLEIVYGSREGDDLLQGADTDEFMRGDGGNDTLIGRAGDDTLNGEDGNDRLVGGDGRDRLDGGDGNDLIDASGGTADSQGYGDYIRPGLGSDTILGHAAHYASGDGIDISYGPLSGIGGMTITVGADGGGTAISGTAGLVNDTFTFAHYFEGSGDGDSITGSDADHFEGYAPLGGADTIDGGDGFDQLNYSYEASYYNDTGSGITVNVAAGTVVDTQGFTDSFTGIEEILGSDFADNMAAGGFAGGVRFRGEDGDDSLIGGAGGDYLEGGTGNDSITGGAGNDTINDGRGVDIVDAGAGTDLHYRDLGVDFEAQSFVAVINLTQGRLFALDDPDSFDTLLNFEDATLLGDFDMQMIGTLGNNRLTTDVGDDTITGGLGNDTIDAGLGEDTAVLTVAQANATVTEMADGAIRIVSSQGTDLFTEVEIFEFSDGSVSAADLLGEDTVDVGGGIPGQLFPGGDGPDLLIGTPNDDTIAGAGGDDTLNGRGGNDNIAASDGNDLVDGGAGNDSIGGGLGNDSILGGAGNDVIGAGQGNDEAIGGTGDDIVNGGPGDDMLAGGTGDDTMGASFGNDLVEGGDGDDSLGGGTGRDTLLGQGGDDALGAGEGNDSVDGGAGNDFLAGGGRNDVVLGGTGDDTINGGAGNDTMDGGTGADVFVFNDFVDGEQDIILGFEDGSDSFRMTGIVNAPGTGLQGRVDALNITDIVLDGEAGVSMTYEGHTILITGVAAADLGVDDFSFV